MTELLIENVRCFSEPDPARLAPVTLLVGENSTGKSTFLAMLRLAWDLANMPSPPNFNEEPFLLGSFLDIANYRGGRWRAKTFSVGLRAAVPEDAGRLAPGNVGDRVDFLATFENKGSQPHLRVWEIKAGHYRMEFVFDDAGSIRSTALDSPSGSVRLSGEEISAFPLPARVPLPHIGFLLRVFRRQSREEHLEGTAPSDSDLAILSHLGAQISGAIPSRPVAVAPVRTKPQRTYDPVADTAVPEGGHVPMILAREFNTRPREWKKLQQALDDFGETSGLFNTLSVKQLGKKGAGPFQIRLNYGGPDFNLADVGYGVSQSLPIVVDSLRSPPGTTFLIQQPEVHLHPRAQAALGSLLVRLAKAEDKRFVVETHSDYLIDRVRMEVRDDEAITPEDVQILYFERTDVAKVEIHPLSLDDHGNIVDVPPGYRQFFLDEERRFLGV